MTIAASGAAVARGAPESVEQNKAIGCRGTTAKSRAYYHEGMLRSLLLALLSTAATSGAFAPRLPVAAAVTARDTGGKSWTLLSPDAHQFDLLFFVATDCPISNRYAPEIARICADYRGRGVRCFLVYPETGLDSATVSSHTRDYGLSAAGPAIIDTGHVLVRAVGPRVTPEAALYSSAGRVYRGRIDDLYVDAGRSRRQATQHDLRLRIEAALAGRSIVAAETEAVGCFIANP